jgi:hypothetical protein
MTKFKYLYEGSRTSGKGRHRSKRGRLAMKFFQSANFKTTWKGKEKVTQKARFYRFARDSAKM